MAEDLDVELDENELAFAIIEAKHKKRAFLKMQENDKVRREKASKLMTQFTPDGLIIDCEQFFYDRFKTQFVFDDDNKVIVYELAKYFSNDESFNRGDYNLNKGILLMGNVGRGKSWLMSFFQKNKKRCFTIKPCNEVADEYLVYKDDVMKMYSTPVEKPLHDPAVYFQKFIGYCFDDLGTEEIKNAFGSKKNVMADLIMTIYNKYNKKGFTLFHFITNLNEDEIEQKYGSRVLSRLNEMFNVFHMDGKDRRFK